ncbi:MAG TPA: branched-chain amino acid ABC transporter permease [Gammaproteobacteria bacterium]|nr:branched-chain amino acid ABC transporter permease [Gammaproteobacteria bacterium]
MGSAYAVRMLVEASCFAVIALGLTIQWGYAGLFNAGVMGFIALGGYMAVLFSYPVNAAFWNSQGPAALLGVAGRLLLGIVSIVLLRQVHRIGVGRHWRNVLLTLAVIATYLTFLTAINPAADLIEGQAGFIGGLGLPVGLGWLMGGLAAAAVGYWIGRICLGLRSDYLAIATLGIAEIIKAFLKNADWLTHGTLTVSPLPWPVPTPGEIGFVGARSAFLALMVVLIAVIYMLLQRAYQSPWGRIIRAIRDNETAAAAMGKDVNRRRLQIFVLGSLLMGIGGAALVSFSRIFDPSGFIPLHHTFLLWVMVILGGAGNNLGTLFGAVLVYIIWVMSEPATLLVFDFIRETGSQWFDWVAPADLDSRALQMRVFIIGLTITLVLRFAPKGVIPEEVVRH